VVDISKAFYDVLLSEQMLNIINEDIDRLSRSLNDAYSLYKNGSTDRIDYNRATLSLNNVRSQRISVINSIVSKLSYLKQLMGYPDNKPLALKYDFISMKKDILIDTLENIHFNDRIEYQLLQTNIRLQKLSINYYKQSLIPSLSGFANYNINYQNDNFASLYNKSFPNSAAGLSLSFPIFEGTRRLQNLKKSKLSYERMALDTINLKNEMSKGYLQALASYKSNLAVYNMTQKNIDIARDIYKTVMFQYNEGIKTYLEVIISETDLLTAQINNLSALILLMYSKIDVQQALGKISVNY
jgi:outer membrane protein TolC